ncbi:MAG: hypothetical protein AAF762_11860, partial [Pseudomonadota bacterium]
MGRTVDLRSRCDAARVSKVSERWLQPPTQDAPGTVALMHGVRVRFGFCSECFQECDELRRFVN